MATLDIIMLSNTINHEIYNMTKHALKTLKESIGRNDFKVILVETNKDLDLPYDDADVLLKPGIPFNYNTYLNLAAEHCVGDYTCIVNNDVNFHKDWWYKMEKAMDKHNLDTASPRSPTLQNGIVPHAEIKHRFTPETTVRVGFELIINFCGWCWVMKKEVKDWIFPLDEQFSFFFQDNDIIMRLKEKGCKHGLVAASKVDHFGQKSHGTFKSQEEWQKNTFALEKNFRAKWGHKF